MLPPGEGRAYGLHEIGQLSRVGSVLHRSCTTPHSGRLGSGWSKSWSLSVRRVKFSTTPPGRSSHLDSDVNTTRVLWAAAGAHLYFSDGRHLGLKLHIMPCVKNWFWDKNENFLTPETDSYRWKWKTEPSKLTIYWDKNEKLNTRNWLHVEIKMKNWTPETDYILRQKRKTEHSKLFF